MLDQKRSLLVRVCSSFTALLLLLAGCGQSSQTVSSTPVGTATSREYNLQATVNTLETQLAIQSTSVPTMVSTEIPAATTAPTTAASEASAGTENPIIGKWAYSMSTLEGTPEPQQGSVGTETFEFFSDNSVEMTVTLENGKVDKLKGTYKLSNNNTKLEIIVGDSSMDYTFDGTRIVQHIGVFTKIGPKAQPLKEEIIYTRVK